MMIPGDHNHDPPPAFPAACQTLLMPSQMEYRPRRRLCFRKTAAALVNLG